MQNIDELGNIYKRAQDLVTDREGAYRDGWKQEDLRDLYLNLHRKVKHLKFLVDGYAEWDESAREALLDAMNYAAFSYYQVSQRRIPRVLVSFDYPTNWLGLVQPLGDWDSVLVDRALQDDEYLAYFRKSSRPKLLNNIKIGTDTPLGTPAIKAVWDVLDGIKFVLSPDWGNNHQNTLDYYGESCGLFGKENVIGVIQGVTKEEIEECLECYGSKVAVGFDVGSLHEVSEIEKVCRRALVVSQIKNKKIHLLGLTNPAELLLYHGNMNIESISTGYPMLLAFMGRKLIPYQGRVKDISSYNYMDMKSSPINLSTFRLVEDNIKQLRMALA